MKSVLNKKQDMRTMQERAKELAKRLCINGGDPELKHSYNEDVEQIILALQEQSALSQKHYSGFESQKERASIKTIISFTPLERHVLGYALYCLKGFNINGEGEYVNEQIPALVLSAEEYSAFARVRTLKIGVEESPSEEKGERE